MEQNNVHISYSEYSKYKQCGHLHLLTYYLKLYKEPPSIHLHFGNNLHQAIEKILKEGWTISKAQKSFSTEFQKNMQENMAGAKEFFEKTPGQIKIIVGDFLEQGKHLLNLIDFKSLFKEYELTSVEEALYENIYDNFYFKGFIDLGLKKKSSQKRLIRDWKSSTEKWNLDYKLTNDEFLAQMRLYKYFWARKNNIDLSDIGCEYVVLNRLKSKKNPQLGFGEIQMVPVNSTEHEIRETLQDLALVVKNIHINQTFKKVKLYGDAKKGCIFCPFKDGRYSLCDFSPDQDKYLLAEHQKQN